MDGAAHRAAVAPLLPRWEVDIPTFLGQPWVGGGGGQLRQGGRRRGQRAGGGAQRSSSHLRPYVPGDKRRQGFLRPNCGRLHRRAGHGVDYHARTVVCVIRRPTRFAPRCPPPCRPPWPPCRGRTRPGGRGHGWRPHRAAVAARGDPSAPRSQHRSRTPWCGRRRPPSAPSRRSPGTGPGPPPAGPGEAS